MIGGTHTHSNSDTMARGICPVQVKVKPKKQGPLTHKEELLALEGFPKGFRTQEEARVLLGLKGNEAGVPIHPVVRKVRCLFGDDYDFVDKPSQPSQPSPLPPPSQYSAAVDDFGDFGEFGVASREPLAPLAVVPKHPAKSALFGLPDDEDRFESMRAQLAALQARVTFLEKEKAMWDDTLEKRAEFFVGRLGYNSALILQGMREESDRRSTERQFGVVLEMAEAAMAGVTSRVEAARAARTAEWEVAEAAWRKKIEEAEAAWHKKIEDSLSSRLNDTPKKSKSLFSGMRSMMSFSRRPPRSLEPLCKPLILGYEK